MSCGGLPSACELMTVIAIQRMTTVADAMGGRAKTWATIESPYAAVVESPGGEGAYAGGRRSAPSYTATIRFTDVSPKDRVLYDGKVFNIASVVDIKLRRQFMKLTLQENVPA